jgi:hypothetical protein
MLAELGRRGQAALTRGTDAGHEAVGATVLHLRRIAGAVSGALVRVTREAQDLAWDYQDVAADLRRPRAGGATLSDPGELAQEPSRPVLRVVRPDE